MIPIICLFEICNPLVVRSEHSHSFIDSLDNQLTASGPVSCIRRRPPGNAVSAGHSSTMFLVVWWLSPQGQAGDAITPRRCRDSAHFSLATSQMIQSDELTSRYSEP